MPMPPGVRLSLFLFLPFSDKGLDSFPDGCNDHADESANDDAGSQLDY